MAFDLKDHGLKLLTIGMPLLTSSIAIVYDVGFFFGLDAGFFTFFTLSEHLVFALQAIPFAVIPAMTIIGFAATTWFGYYRVVKIGNEAGEQAKSMTPSTREEWLTRLQKQVDRNRRLDPWIQGVFVILCLGLVLAQAYTSAFLLLVSIVVSKLVFPISNLKSEFVQVGLLAISLAVGLVSPFLVGYERSQAVLSSKEATETILIEGMAIRARLIRGGERGVLFFSFENKKLGFLRWDAIKKIETL